MARNDYRLRRDRMNRDMRIDYAAPELRQHVALSAHVRACRDCLPSVVRTVMNPDNPVSYANAKLYADAAVTAFVDALRIAGKSAKERRILARVQHSRLMGDYAVALQAFDAAVARKKRKARAYRNAMERRAKRPAKVRVSSPGSLPEKAANARGPRKHVPHKDLRKVEIRLDNLTILKVKGIYDNR